LRTGFADVRTAQFFPVLKQNRAISLLVGKRLAARLAGVRAGLDVPFVHGRRNLTTNAMNEHEEISKHPRISPIYANFLKAVFHSLQFAQFADVNFTG
jgi:hypothetical protein